MTRALCACGRHASVLYLRRSTSGRPESLSRPKPMSFLTLLQRNLTWFWRTNAAVVCGVAVAVSVLAGALLVGDSVRASLRHLALERLGATEFVVASGTFFRDALAEDVAEAAGGGATRTAPLIALDGLVAHGGGEGRRAGSVRVYGVDDRFWQFHGIADVAGPVTRGAFLSPALAEELGAAEGDSVLVRVQRPSAIPSGVLQGRRDDTSRAVRVTVERVLESARLGEFSVVPTQGPVRAIFVPIERLQRDLEQPGSANTLLVSTTGSTGDLGTDIAAIDRAVADAARVEDLGLKLIPVPARHAVAIESGTGLVDEPLRRIIVEEAERLGHRTLPVLTYLANEIRIGDASIPYSVITAMDVRAYADLHVTPAGDLAEQPAPEPLWLNEWATRELAARPGDSVSIEYFLWSDEAGLQTKTADFVFAGTVPMAGAGGDRTLTPEYPGITDAPRIGDWDPPFPVDLRRIRPQDERYWDDYRAAPKAFITLERGQELWPSPFGTLTAVRVALPGDAPLSQAAEEVVAAVRARYTPALAGVVTHPVRARALEAAQGTTDFGEYFVYFSFFLVVSALLLTGLFFKLGTEQRAREVGLLQALGFRLRTVRRLLTAEGLVLAIVGSLLGIAGAVAFSGLILFGLRTWWVDAVGTRALVLHVAPLSLALGAAGGVAMALAAMAVTLRGLAAMSPRALLGGSVSAPRGMVRTGSLTDWRVPLVCTVAAAGLLLMAAAGLMSTTGAFFGAGALLLVAGLAAFSRWLRRSPGAAITEGGTWSVARLGARQTRWRPGRSVLVVALIASATFMIVAVSAFRRDTGAALDSPASGTGGFPFYAETLVPVMHDPGTPAGRQELGFPSDDELVVEGLRIARFRMRPGDEGSCLNLYRPTNPRIIAPTDAFRQEGRFTFASSLAETDEERQNPWLLLDRMLPDGAVPVIGDATSLTYALHRSVGDDLVIDGPGGEPITLRVVAALSDSMLQSELIVGERDFVRLFPRHEGYRFFLLDAPVERRDEVAATLEDRLADYGFDARSAPARLASYHRVENTYLSTFQTLGGLGLVLGTFGLGAVLLRNVLERRRELALLRAVGYRANHLTTMVFAESVLLLVAGLLGGTLAALLAIAPALAARGGTAPVVSTLVLLAVVFAAGLASSLVATRAAARMPLLAALRSE
jgi:putative ABC transport system permease protein